MDEVEDRLSELLELDLLAHSYPDGDAIGQMHYADLQDRLKELFEAGETSLLAEYQRRAPGARADLQHRRDRFRLQIVADEARALGLPARFHVELIKAIARRCGSNVADVVGALFPRLGARGAPFLRDLMHSPFFAGTPAASDAKLHRSLKPYLEPWRLRLHEHIVGEGVLLPILSFGYRFYSVGQGLFTAGVLSRRSARPFRWVYDCGSITKGNYLDNAIAALKQECPPVGPGKQHLDLVVISHFDGDHVNGLLRLLRHFSVGTLLLPYLAPWQRLAVALVEGAAVDGDLLSFLIAPAEFVLTRDGVEVGTVLFAPPAAGEREAGPAPERPEEPRRDGRSPETEDDWTLDYPTDHPPGPGEDAGDAESLGGGRVRMLAPGAALRANDVWEFYPYNDAEFEGRADASFRRRANAWVAALKHMAQRGDYERCAFVLDILVHSYDVQFGPDGWARNVISLFLYAGPVGDARLLAAREISPECGRSGRHRRCPHFLADHRFGQLTTGDGFLHDRTRLGAFEAHFHPEGRLARTGVFQVMHHGSRLNWCPEVGPAISPLASLFSSDPTRKRKHPHDEVWKAFRPYRRRQVDKQKGWSLAGAFIRLR